MSEAKTSSKKLLKITKPTLIGILLLPLMTIHPSFQSYLLQQSNFILTLILLLLIYLGHEYHFKNTKQSITSSKDSQQSLSRYLILQFIRKIFVSCMTAYVIGLLISEISHTINNVYKIYYGEQIMFLFRLVIVLANLQGSLQMLLKTHRKYKQDPIVNIQKI